MSPWVREDLGKAIWAVNVQGVESPLDLALDAATMDLKPLAGKSAVIIFTRRARDAEGRGLGAGDEGRHEGQRVHLRWFRSARTA